MLASVTNLTSFTRGLRGTDKRSMKRHELGWCKLHNIDFYEHKGRGGLIHREHKNVSSSDQAQDLTFARFFCVICSLWLGIRFFTR